MDAGALVAPGPGGSMAASSPTRAMDFYSCEGKVVRRDGEGRFGWWLSDLRSQSQPVMEVRVEPASDDDDDVRSSSSSDDSELGSLFGELSPAGFQSLSLMQRLSPSAEELSRLVSRSSPTHRPLEAVLNVGRRGSCEEPAAAESPRAADAAAWGGRAASQWHSSPRGRELNRSSNELETAMRILQGKLRAVEAGHRQMVLDVDSIHRGLQAEIATTTRLTKAAQSLVEELQDVRYLDELIFMMEGHLDRISLRVWPFTTAHVSLGPDTCQEYNLVV
ncbi:uncharacterized protein LOC134535537 [Bacillus rossius redtenbacheri]|uniref:uncharacterized protein LOC134535537 n=1 Tax=Bacillus rossius redtenbacheri TaxID=93214 RepID=UPI002FDD6852